MGSRLVGAPAGSRVRLEPVAGLEDALPPSCPLLDLINELAVQSLTLGNRATCHRDGRGLLPESSLVGLVMVARQESP